ncbi:hypothetical protein MPSEU_000856200 [Mayamaea pseudoterrestris]|nr:hypothetical protein MPSEU_000856200 [Mayamaea pseudoterrestris]
MDDRSIPGPDDWHYQGPPPPHGYYNRFTIYPPQQEDFPPASPFRDDLYPPLRHFGPPPEAYWSPHPHHHHAPFASPPYSPYEQPLAPQQHRAPPFWSPPSILHAPSNDEGMFAPPPVLRLHGGRQSFSPNSNNSGSPPGSWPSPPKDNNGESHKETHEEHEHGTEQNDEATDHDEFVEQKDSSSSPSFQRAVDEQEKSSPSSQATQHTSNINSEGKDGGPLSLLAKTASTIGPPKKRLQQKTRFDSGTPLSVSPIPTSAPRIPAEESSEDDPPPKPITPMTGAYYPNGRMAPPPPQYSHRAYHQHNSVYRYEPWQQMDGPSAVCSFDSHDSANRKHVVPPPPSYYYGGDPYGHNPPPPPPPHEGYRGGPWYPPPPPQQHPPLSATSQQQPPPAPYYQTPPSDKVESVKRRNGPYTQVQQKGGGANKHLLKKKFSWKQYPDLEDFLVHHREEYLAHSCRNYSLEQKQYNNWLTQQLIQKAEASNLYFDPQDFNFVAIRDRIRCYYKSYVQTARKRGLPLPSELETSRNVLNAKKPRLEDIEKLPKDGSSSSSSPTSESAEKRSSVNENQQQLPRIPTDSKQAAAPSVEMTKVTKETTKPVVEKSAAKVVDSKTEDVANAADSLPNKNAIGQDASANDSKASECQSIETDLSNTAADTKRTTRRMTTRGLARGGSN